MKSTSTMLNPGSSAASAQHPLLPPCHRTPSLREVKKNPRSLELLKLKKSEMVVTYIQILVYYSTFIQTKASQFKSFRDQFEFLKKVE